jgi:hypothetical protein
MRNANFLLALAGLYFFIPRALAGDGDEIKRPPLKEPVYQTKYIEYWLLVFGAEAKTRVWVVRDGDTWYIDRNGNGDLTEEGKRVEAKDGYFKEPVQVSAGKSLYKITQFADHSINYYIAVEAEGKHRQYTTARSARSPKDARIIHFDGPLVMGLKYTDPAKQPVERRNKSFDFSVLIGTADPSHNDPWGPVIENTKYVPADAHPVAEFEFAPKNAGGEPIKLKVVLKERC